jgi:hypothetical protein
MGRLLSDPAIIAEPAKWLCESIGFWVQTAMLAVSALAGILIIRSRGKQEARRATVDLIVEQKRDQELIKAKLKIREMHEHKETNLARHLQNPESEEFKAILLALNTHEFIATGIRTGAFSEEVYKRLRWSTVIRDWESFQGFVADMRNEKRRATFFQDFEWLHKRWKKYPLRADSI